MTGLWSLRVAKWAVCAARQTAADLERSGLLALDGVRPVPAGAPPEAVRYVRAALRWTEATCMVRAAVMQGWHEGQGRRVDLVIGVTAPGRSQESFRAHAWLDGEEPESEVRFHEIFRRSPRG